MKLLKISILLVLVSFFVACGDGEDCTQSNWVGVYEGKQICDGDTETVTVTITASGSDAVLIKYETPSGSLEFEPLTPIDCDISETSSDGQLTLTTTVSIMDDKLSLIDILTNGVDASSCEITATRN